MSAAGLQRGGGGGDGGLFLSKQGLVELGKVAPRACRRARPDARPRFEKRPVREEDKGGTVHKLYISFLKLFKVKIPIL